MSMARPVPWLALLIVACFLGLGSLWIAWPGLEYDETLFVLSSYPRNEEPIAYTMHFKGRPVALMIDTYLGALKGWLYIPLLKAWPGSVAAIRLAALLTGAAGLYFFYLFANRAFGRQAAVAALSLAATDPIYLFTTRLDWGPVAMQHLCLLAGCCGVLRWWQERRQRDLALAFFAMGVGIFDKATFLWLLVALLVSTLIVFPRQLRSALQPRPMAVALAALVIGSAPFLYYNWKRKGQSFRQESDHTSQYAAKLRNLEYTLRGASLVGWISRDMTGAPLEPPDSLGRAVYAVAPTEPIPETLLLPATLLALMLLPAVPYNPFGRGMTFLLLFCLLAFLQMLPIRAAGAVHHVALLLPFPQLFVAAGLVGAKEGVCRWLTGTWRRRFMTSVLALYMLLLIGANLRAVTLHYFRIIGYGGGAMWSEAIYSLENALQERRPEAILLLDWGMITQLRFLSGDRLPVVEAIQPQGPTYDAGYLERYIHNPRMLFVKYATGGPAAFPQIAEAFSKLAALRGYRTEIVDTIRDRQGRPVYEILSLQKSPAAGSPPGPPR